MDPLYIRLESALPRCHLLNVKKLDVILQAIGVCKCTGWLDVYSRYNLFHRQLDLLEVHCSLVDSPSAGFLAINQSC